MRPAIVSDSATLPGPLEIRSNCIVPSTVPHPLSTLSHIDYPQGLMVAIVENSIHIYSSALQIHKTIPLQIDAQIVAISHHSTHVIVATLTDVYSVFLGQENMLHDAHQYQVKKLALDYYTLLVGGLVCYNSSCFLY